MSTLDYFFLCICGDWLLFVGNIMNLWPLMLCGWPFFQQFCMVVIIEVLIVKLI